MPARTVQPHRLQPAADGAVPVVGQREPCPCGSGKRYKACHGRTEGVAYAGRPFQGRADETDWVALREIVPAATAPLPLRDQGERQVTLSTVLPLSWAGMVRADGRAYLGLQVPSRSGDVSRDLAGALLDVLAAERGSSVVAAGLPGPGPRLQDLLDDAPLEVSVREGFDHWVQDAPDPGGELAAAMERANASVVPTAALSSVRSAYWCRMRDREHLRWVLPEDEEPLLDAMARLAPVGGLSLGAGTSTSGASGRTVCWCRSGTCPQEAVPRLSSSPRPFCGAGWTRRWPRDTRSPPSSAERGLAC